MIAADVIHFFLPRSHHILDQIWYDLSAEAKQQPWWFADFVFGVLLAPAPDSLNSLYTVAENQNHSTQEKVN